MGKTLPTSALGDRLPAMQEAWLSWLRIKHPALANAHGDLVQQTSADLLYWASNHQSKNYTEEVRQVGFRILQRRVADMFRDPARSWTSTGDDEPATEAGLNVLDGDSEPSKSAEYFELLKAIVSVLSGLPKEERELLLRMDFSSEVIGHRPLTDAQRQQLSRLRQRMRHLLLKNHGINLHKKK